MKKMGVYGELAKGRLAKDALMYDDIDKDETPEAPKKPEAHVQRQRNRLRIGFAILLGVALLIAAAIFTSNTPQDPDIDHAALAVEQAAYTAALTDSSQALRRARLKDFIEVYPESDNWRAAMAQLDILNAKEQTDWAALSHVIFDTDATRLDKLSALEIYTRAWDSALLGGRAEAVARIRTSLEQDEEDLPDRELAIDPDAFPEAGDRETLVGGAFDVQGTYIPPSVTMPSDNDLEDEVVIRPPRLRRNARPRYPSRALRRNIEAVVVLKLFINAAGRVEMTEVVSVDADRYRKDFVRASERAARRLRFYPKTIDGTPVPTVGVEKRFRFSIDD